MAQHRFTSSSASYATVGVTSASAVSAKSERCFLVLTAHPDNTGIIYLNLGTTAVVDSGVPLIAGGSLVIEGDAPFQGAVYAIASVAAQKLCILEG